MSYLSLISRTGSALPPSAGLTRIPLAGHISSSLGRPTVPQSAGPTVPQSAGFNNPRSASRPNRQIVTLLHRLTDCFLSEKYKVITVSGLYLSRLNSIYLSGHVTAVDVFRNPNTISFCLTTDLLLNVLFSWLLVHLPSIHSIDENQIKLLTCPFSFLYLYL